MCRMILGLHQEELSAFGTIKAFLTAAVRRRERREAGSASHPEEKRRKQPQEGAGQDGIALIFQRDHPGRAV